MILVVNNFVQEGDVYRDMVVRSKVFGLIIDAAHYKQSNVTLFYIQDY